MQKSEVAKQHQRGDLNEKQIFEYAHSHRLAEATVGLDLLCSLPVEVVERVLFDKNHEIALILAKALAFCWETTMALLLLAQSLQSDGDGLSATCHLSSGSLSAEAV